MAQETKRQSAPKSVPRINSAQRIKVVQLMRQMKDRSEELKNSLKLVTEFVFDKTLDPESNQDVAEFGEALDILREGAEEMAYKVRQEKAETVVLASLSEEQPSVKIADAGTVTRKTRDCWSVSDNEAFLRYIVANRMWDAITTNAVREEWAKKFKADHKKAPPGCKVFEKVTLSFVKPRQKVVKK